MFIVMNRTFILLYGMTVSSLLRMCVCTCTVQRTKPPSKTVGIQGPTVAREPRKKNGLGECRARQLELFMSNDVQ
jgi:hypothetical protein